MSTAKSNGTTRKRPPPHHPSPPAKIQATATPSKPSLDDEFLDEDVYLDELLIQEDEDLLIQRDIDERQALASRLAKWARPPLSDDYVSQTKNIG